MIQHANDLGDPPPGLDSRAASFVEAPDLWHQDPYILKVKQVLREGNEHDFSGYYRDKAKDALFTSFHFKCCSCESDMRANKSAYEIDHYRPKNKVTGSRHPGYFWLAYEWSNLLPICKTCNLAKSNRFPIKGKAVMPPDLDTGELTPSVLSGFRADQPDYLGEKPLLFHPKIDQPERYFRFVPNGKLTAVAENQRAQVNIDTFKLNRDGLVLVRAAILTQWRNRLVKYAAFVIFRQKLGLIQSSEAFRDCLELAFRTLLEEIDLMDHPSKAYSLMGAHMKRDFEYLLLSECTPQTARVIKEARGHHQKGWV